MKKILRVLAYPALSLAALALDLVSKQLIKLAYAREYGVPHDVIGSLLRFTYVHNKGITFGMFTSAGSSGGAGVVFLVLLATAALAFVVYLFLNVSRLLQDGKPQLAARLTLAGIVGGALGNIVDRAFNGYVTDFIDMGIGSLRWFTYNIADMFVVLGALTILILFLFFEKKKTTV